MSISGQGEEVAGGSRSVLQGQRTPTEHELCLYYFNKTSISLSQLDILYFVSSVQLRLNGEYPAVRSCSSYIWREEGRGEGGGGREVIFRHIFKCRAVKCRSPDEISFLQSAV